MALLTGTWILNANGHDGELVISSVDAQGNISGTLYGHPIEGFWNEAAQEIFFIRIVNANSPSRQQIYTGYQFKDPRNPGGGENYYYWLTGHFEAFTGTGGHAARSRYGWHASLFIVG